MSTDVSAKDAAVLKADIRWLMDEVLALSGHVDNHIPDHGCGYYLQPDEGCCLWHERWCEIAVRCGLMDDWAKDEELQ